MKIATFLNDLDEETAHTVLEQCCASQKWIGLMLVARARKPFESDEEVEFMATSSAKPLTDDDWLEAFSAHPRIGDVATLREKFANTSEMAAGEQSGIAAASEATIQELAQLNDAYFEKFGYIFIVCATGKSADEMQEILKTRLPNDPQAELRIAAAEQMKITLLRLRKFAQ